LTVESIPFRSDVFLIDPTPTGVGANGAKSAPATDRSSWMAQSFRLTLILATLLGVAPMLSACHTTAGFGQDLSQGGHALTNSANANAPNNPHP
jgi:predicted small secreted protein